MRILSSFILLLVTSSLVCAAGGDAVPRIDPAPSCRGASRALNANADLQHCLQAETAAHDQLVKEWTTFAASDRASCVQLSMLGGEPSYVELLTCLEMATAVREAPPGSFGKRPQNTLGRSLD